MVRPAPRNAETSEGEIEAKNAVVATGPYQRALMPDMLRMKHLVHASGYRNPDWLPPMAVLVVGLAHPAQIAEELLRRPPRLSGGRPPHKASPRRHRGRDRSGG